MRYETETDKEFMSLIIDEFEIQMYEDTSGNFNKRSSITEFGGRPYLYSPREIGIVMVNHFRECIKYNQPFTITGLCMRLGITRQGMLKMGKSSNKQIVDIIKKGKEMVEAYLEMQLHLNLNPTFAIFLLKNMGWSDKRKIERKRYTKLSDEEIAKAKERLKYTSE